jgi:hypothetical protein
MEAGYVMGRTVTGGKDPATIGWLPQDFDPATKVFGFRYAAEPLAALGVTIFSPTPRFPASRCPQCRRVEFSYADADVKT